MDRKDEKQKIQHQFTNLVKFMFELPSCKEEDLKNPYDNLENILDKTASKAAPDTKTRIRKFILHAHTSGEISRKRDKYKNMGSHLIGFVGAKKLSEADWKVFEKNSNLVLSDEGAESLQITLQAFWISIGENAIRKVAK